MRDELCESSLRSSVPWIMTDMYLIKKKKDKTKTKQKKKEKKEKEKKRMQRYVYVSYLTPSIFVVGFIIGGLGEIFMRDELCESSLRSFISWIMDDMYWI